MASFGNKQVPGYFGKLFFLVIPIEIAEKFDHSSVAIKDNLVNNRSFCFVLIQFSEIQQLTSRQQSVQFLDLVFK